MKKKLIAIVTSLAMVATMVPAVAFADADPAADFKSKVDVLPEASELNEYKSAYDTLVAAACAEYVKLADTVDFADGENKPAYDKFRRAVETQWGARFDAVDTAIDTVTPVKKAKTDKDAIQAVADLGTLCTDFKFTGTYSELEATDMYKVLTADAVAAGKVNGLALDAIKADLDGVAGDGSDGFAAKASTAKEEAEAAAPVVLAIAGLDRVTDQSYSAVLTAITTATTGVQALYDALDTAGKKARVGNYEELTQKTEQATALKEAVVEVDTLITAIGTPANLTSKNITKYENAYEAANIAYEKLLPGQQENVTGEDALTTAKENIANYKEGVEKEEAVVAMISKLPAGTNPSDALELAKAKVAFNALNTGTAGTVANLAEGFQANISAVDKSRLDKAITVANTMLDGTEAIAAAVAPVQKLIADLPATITAADKEKVEEAQEAYNAITSAFTSSINSATRRALSDAKKTLSNAVAQMDKIVETNNEEIKVFTDAVNEIGKVVVPNTGTYTDIAANNSVTTAYRTATRAARTAYTTLTDDQKALVEADKDLKKYYDALLLAEKNIAAVATLDEVAVLIQAVPKADTLDLSDTEAVQKVKAAQTAYESLSASDQVKLVNANYITDAELDNYEKAVKKVTDAENQAKLDAAKAALEATTAIDPAAELTAETAAVIRTAKEAVEALTESQQKELDAEALKKLKEELIPLLEAYEEGAPKLENATIAAIDAVTYDGTAKTPVVTVTDKTGTVIADTEYDVRYSNNTNAGTATVIVSAKSGSAYTGSITADFSIEAADINTIATAGKIANQTYNKKAKTPVVTVTAGEKKLVNGSDYTVKYANNTNIGQAKATITGTGNYTGTITATFIIEPAKGKLTSLKAGKKQITVSYEAQKAASGKTGYRIVYSPAKGQAKAVQTTAAKKTIKSLKSGKTYKVKVRAYKTIDGKKYNGEYSTVKKVKVK